MPTRHIEALGNYIEEKRFEKIIVAGDWWDMPATSNFNTAMQQEGLRIQEDIDSGNRAMNLLWRAVNKRNKKSSVGHRKQYHPEKHFIFGNHEYHMERFAESHPAISTMLGYELLNLDVHGFIKHPFLVPVDIDGILYCHYFKPAASARPIGGQMDNRLKLIAQSFTQGHLQEFMYGERQIPSGKRLHGLVAGAFYMHDEAFKIQGNAHWRGVIVKHEVRNGEYDIMKVSLNYLLRKYL